MIRWSVLLALLGACVSIDAPDHSDDWYTPITPTQAPIVSRRVEWQAECGRGTLEKREQCLQAKERAHDEARLPRKRRIRK